jgi:hypothetical protein
MKDEGRPSQDMKETKEEGFSPPGRVLETVNKREHA